MCKCLVLILPFTKPSAKYIWMQIISSYKFLPIVRNPIEENSNKVLLKNTDKNEEDNTKKIITPPKKQKKPAS